MEKKYYTLTETAEKLGISRQTLYNRIKQGTAPKHDHILGKYAFFVTAVDKLANQ